MPPKRKLKNSDVENFKPDSKRTKRKQGSETKLTDEPATVKAKKPKRESKAKEELKPVVKQEPPTDSTENNSATVKVKKPKREQKAKEEISESKPVVKQEPATDSTVNYSATKTETKVKKEKHKVKQVKREKTDCVESGGQLAEGDMFVGAHVSAAGGVYNGILNATKIGCRAFAIFLKNQRRWDSKPYEQKTIDQFKELMKEHNFHPDMILPHGSYLVNCGSPSTDTVAKSKACLLDELKRCEQLGLTKYNFHPGSSCGKQTVEKTITQIAQAINECHQKTEYVTTVIENMCCQGNTVGGKFEDLASIIEQVEDKNRIGVCIDTCHAYAAGFDLATDDGYEDMWTKFDQIVGLNYLKGMHLNDSKGDLGSHLDRHELIGKGKLGKATFVRIMNDPRLKNIPLILETPDETAWEREIKLLYSMQA